MSVLIRGMEMPKYCCDCPCSGIDSFGDLVCKLLRRTQMVDDVKFADCPLVEIPPHGALMDRDDFFANCPELVDGYKTITDDLVVIPAEEGE